MLRKALLGLAAALLLGLAGRAEAVVMVDPGTVGQQSNSPLVVEESFPGGQTTSFHYVFEDMKHIEATEWGWMLPQDFDPVAEFTISWLFYLTDMFGNEIDGTRGQGTAQINGIARVSLDPIIAHDFFIELTPTLNIPVNILVNGIVGEWVPMPEPATIALFGFGLAGLGFAARRRKAA